MRTRRELITLLGGAAVVPALARLARAQQAALPVIGFLGTGSADGWSELLRAFRGGLAEAGFREGENVAIEYRWAEGELDRLPALAADLVGRRVSVIAAPGSGPAAVAAKAATATIPVVFRLGADPVEAGLVASLNHPGGNLTGVAMLGVGLGPKRLELLHELIPDAKVFGLLINPTNKVASGVTTRELRTAADALGLQLRIVHASSERDYDAAFASLVEARAAGLVIGGDGSFTNKGRQLGALSLRHALPTVYQFQDFAAGGGLMSYGGSNLDSYRLVGIYVGRILKGEQPAELPVQQSVKVELIINLKTAKTLRLEIPPTLRARADEVIE
jgi:putative tryptophan/tyrosine transport system substrate-binding protein